MPRNSGRSSSSGAGSRGFSTGSRYTSGSSKSFASRQSSSRATAPKPTPQRSLPSGQSSTRASSSSTNHTQSSSTSKEQQKLREERARLERERAELNRERQNVNVPVHEVHVRGPGFMSNVMQGLAFGTGSAVAHETVHGIANAISGRSGDKNSESSAPAPAQSSNNGPELPASVPISETAPASTESETYPTTSPYASGVLPERYDLDDVCGIDKYALNHCLETHPDDTSFCQKFYEKYETCMRQHASGPKF